MVVQRAFLKRRFDCNQVHIVCRSGTGTSPSCGFVFGRPRFLGHGRLATAILASLILGAADALLVAEALGGTRDPLCGAPLAAPRTLLAAEAMQLEAAAWASSVERRIRTRAHDADPTSDSDDERQGMWRAAGCARSNPCCGGLGWNTLFTLWRAAGCARGSCKNG